MPLRMPAPSSRLQLVGQSASEMTRSLALPSFSATDDIFRHILRSLFIFEFAGAWNGHYVGLRAQTRCTAAGDGSSVMTSS